MRMTQELKRIRLAALMGLVTHSRNNTSVTDELWLGGLIVTWHLRLLCRNQAYLKFCGVAPDHHVRFEPGKREVR